MRTFQTPREPRWKSSGYLVAIIALAAAVLLRWLIDPLLGQYLLFAPLFAAVAVAVLYGGYRPALLAAVLGVLAYNYLFMEPRGSFAIHRVDYCVAISIYLLTCSIIIGFGEALRVAKRRAAEGYERLRTTLASIGDAVITTDTEGHITNMNAVAELLTGWKNAEAIGEPLDAVFRILNEQAREPVENPALRALREGVIVGLANHTVLIAKDGTERPIDDSAAPIRCAEGEIVGCVLVFRDVTARRKAEKALHESEHRLHLALKAGQMGTWEWILQTNEVIWSPGLEAIHGLAPGTFPGTFAAYQNDIHPDDLERVLRAITQTVEQGEDHHVEYRLVLPDGRIRWVEGRGKLFGEASGRTPHMIGVCIDITDRKQMDEALRQSEARKTAMFETTLDCIISINHEGTIIEFNAAAERTFGHRREDMLGRELASVILPPAFRERHRKGMAHYLTTGEGSVLNQRLELSALRADGTEFPVELTVTRIPVDGPPIFTAYLRDITERQKADKTLQASEAKYRAVFDGVGVSLWEEDFSGVKTAIDVLKAEGVIDFPRYFAEHPEFVQKAMGLIRVLDVNDNTVKMFEAQDKTELLGSLPKIFVPESLPVFIEELIAVAEGRTFMQAEASLNTIRGSPICVVFTMTLPPSTEEPYRVLFSVLDVTERKRAEVRREFLVRTSAELTGSLDYDTTLRNIAQLTVPRFADWCAVDMAEGAKGETKCVAIVHTDPSKVDLAHELRQRYPPDPQASQGVPNVLRTGRAELYREIPDELLVKNCRDSEHLRIVREIGMKSAIVVPIIAGEKVLGVITFVTAESGRWYDDQDLETAEEIGRRAGIAIENARLFAETKRAEEALREADRRKTEFLAILAHELRSPLAPIRNALEVMRLTGGNGEVVASTFEMMERQVDQLVRLVDDLLDVSRVSRGRIELRKERVELASVVHHTVEAARPLVQYMDHELIVTLPSSPIFLNADPIRLVQVMGNLLNNACKFTKKGGRIWLTVEREGSQAVIRVRDNGVGIAAEHLPNIFDMFMQADTTLERSVSGLGIGLTLVKNLVEMHEGTVEVNSAGVGQGSEFVVRLPIMIETSKPPSPEPPESEPTTPRRILVVDDNQDSATSLALLLKLSGNETHTVYDGEEAVEAAATFKPEVILMDIGLPRLNGYEACRRIREQPWSSGMVLVALTGWGQEEDQQKSKEAGFDAHMVKPMDHATLTKLLVELLPVREGVS